MVKLNVLLLAFVVSALAAVELKAQDAGQRSRDLASALDKTKYKKKEKSDLSIELYVDVKYEPVVRPNINDHAGIYEDDMAMYRLDLQIGPGGVVEGSGYDTRGDDSKRVNFTLRDGRIERALLTATKVFENGDTVTFESVFTNRKVSAGTNPSSIAPRETMYGLGFIQSNEKWSNRVFLKKL